MTSPTFHLPTPLIATALFVALSWSAAALPDWFGMVRTVMMVLGGTVVIIIVLVVAIAIISGVMGMIANLRKPNK